ncbi:SNF2-related protein [Macrophomina phaseolina MS6]|uniref:SNF2-related protein n=1 Tax=Macrophomina phaseolina (strain MS6) TaxID=1126212 RepID=K2RK53_MACPH|nr:SNF2-related protein [Macrophomina phaseolina MS6]
MDTLSINDTDFENIPAVDDDRPFNTINEETYEYLVEYSLRSDEPLCLDITTAQQIESLVADIDRPTTLSNLEAYRTMVEEMHQGEKNEDDRFWMWARLRGAKGTTKISSQTLDNVEIDSLEMGLQWLQFLASDHDDEDSESNTGNDTVSSEVKDLTKEQVDTHKKLETYLGNLEYERQGGRECCEALGIENPQIPRLKNMRLSVVLKPWQTVGIKALVDLEDGEMNGGVLADLVGLGKTWEVTGLLQYRLNQRIEKGEDAPTAKPTLLVCPANLLGQWAEEIGRISGSFDVRIYHGGRLTIDQAAPHSKISKVLRKDDKFFDGSEENSKVIILTSYRTFLKRHGPTAYKNYLAKKLVNEGLSRKDAKRRVDEGFTGSPDTKWDQNLEGCFERVVLDEGHEIRNSDTQTWKSIRWLHAKYYIIATTTPLIDSVRDFSGILGMLQSHNDLWTENSLQNLGAFKLVPRIDPSLPAQERERATFSRDEYLTRFDPWDYEDEHPVSILRLTKESYIEHVAKLRASNHERGRRAREVFKSCMLRRTYNSCIDGTRISDHMPVVQNNIVECRLSDEEFPRYKEIFRECMSKLHRKRKDDVVLDTNVYRQLLLVGTWLNCQHILDYKVNKLREFRKANRSAYDILKDVQSKQKSRRFPSHLTLQLPEPNDKEGILKAFCRGSPKLRALAELIADLVLMRKEKVVVWCTLPAQQLIIEKFLREAGIDARAYHAGLNLDERTRLTKSFNTSDGVVVLIGGYFMSVTGSNWQFFCGDAIMFDEAPSKGVDDQALGRIRRVGQRSYVRVYRLYMLESFDEHLRSRLIVKALPGLMTELNMDIFGVGEHGDGGDEVMLGAYVLEDGKLVSLDDLPCNERDDADVLPADELLMLIQKSLRGDELKLSAGDKMALAKSR